jgi:hypothetical protein
MARRIHTTQPLICATCEVEITGTATYDAGVPFCCSGCMAGGPCTCTYDREPTGDGRIRHCLDIEAALEGWAYPRADKDALITRR